MKPEPVRFAFTWRSPYIVRYRAAAPRRFAVRLNRYPGIVIGAAVQIGRTVLSLKWGAPGRQTAGCVDCAKDVFHSRHTTVAERQAQRSALAEALRTAQAGESRISLTEGEETR